LLGWLLTVTGATFRSLPWGGGTRMAFVGIKNDKDIADLWAYLKQSGADGAKKWNPKSWRGRKSKRAAGRGNSSGSLTCFGLTGLLNPTSIWHNTISIVFHKVFRSCFVHWNRPNQLEQAANAALLLPIASVEDCL
jgi:hypothetical protein